MIYAQPSQTIHATLQLGETGLAGTIGVRIIDAAGTSIAGRSTSGIVEAPAGSGIYIATRSAPSSAGDYEVVWDTGGVAPEWGSEELTIVGVVVPLPVVTDTAGHYATVTDVRNYTPLATQVADDDDLQLILARAERDVDAELAEPIPWGRAATGLKLDPASLEAWRAIALNRAVCAQAEYRLAMGEDFFIRAQHASERGPDFAVTGQLPYIGPKVHRELAGTLLIAPAGIGQLAVTTPLAAQLAPYWTPTNAD